MKTKKGQIAHELREAISAGQYPPGTAIPSIPELMSSYGVARDTVRDAISLLMHEGIVIPKRGVGTIVRDLDPVGLTYSGRGKARTWADQVGAGEDTVVVTEWVAADVDIAHRLNIEPGTPVVHRVRHFQRGQGIAQITDQWIPQTMADAIKEAGGGDLASSEHRPDRPGGKNLFELLADAGHAPTSTEETLGTRMPDPDERDVMEIPPGVPVLVTHRVTDANGTRVETTTAVGAGDRMTAKFNVDLDY